MEWILQLPVLFFSIILHEFSHGWMALRNGDDTAYQEGRLTLNPLPHIDPFGTLLLPALCVLSNAPVFGWAKPVPVQPYRLNHPRRDIVKVALMGPLSNLLLALAAAATMKLLQGGIAAEMLRYAILINFYLAAFNLLPIHPLDGSQVLAGLIPDSMRDFYSRLAPYGFWILLILLMSGLLHKILAPMVQIFIQVFVSMGLLR